MLKPLADAKQFLHAVLLSSFSVGERSHFESTIVSVDQEHFKAELKKFKEALLKLQTTIESERSNMLVHLNVGLYPIE